MKIRLIKLVSSFYFLLVGHIASADMLGLYFGLGVWQNEPDGDLYSSLGLQDAGKVGLEDDNATFFYLKFEHPVPSVPNIRIAQSEASNSGSYSFNNPAMQTVMISTDIDLDHSDYSFYWEILDTAVDLDLGLTARRFDGALTQEYFVDGTLASTDHQPIEGTIPLIYISANVDLPFAGVYIGAEINSLSYRGDGFNDLTARIGWTTENWILPEFGFEAGYRRFSIDIDARNSLDATLDLTMDGYFINLVAHF